MKKSFTILGAYKMFDHKFNQYRTEVCPEIEQPLNKFIKFRRCLEAASECTNIPLSSRYIDPVSQPPSLILVVLHNSLVEIMISNKMLKKLFVA